jgi:hypothetical protein
MTHLEEISRLLAVIKDARKLIAEKLEILDGILVDNELRYEELEEKDWRLFPHAHPELTEVTDG